MIEAYRAALRACDPAAAVLRVVDFDGGRLTVGDATFDRVDPSDVVVIGLGKAAASMARGVAGVVDVERGLVVSDHEEPCPVELAVGDHPIPGAGSLAAGRRLLDTVRATRPTDVVVFLISGGGSAVAEAPTPGVGMDDIAALNRVLTTTAMPITEINEVRSAASMIKGGRLASVAGTTRMATLILSDVVGGDAVHVASGPTIGHGLGSGARSVIARRGLAGLLPGPVLEAVRRSTPVDGDPGPWTVVASPDVAARAAASSLRDAGCRVEVRDHPLEGPVGDAVAAMLAAVPVGGVVVAAGEVVVSVEGVGTGGRNQHAALLAARQIRGGGTTFGAFATDGRDGPTRAAGAIVDGGTWGRITDAGVDGDAALERFDSTTALGAVGALVLVGPTGTNVADLWIAARQPSIPSRKSETAAS